MLKTVAEWLKDERASVLSEKSLVVAIGIIGGILLGGIALPKIKEYAQTIFDTFSGATSEDAFGGQ